MRLAFLTQLWNAKIDFSESLKTGEVKNLEATLNVRTVPFSRYSWYPWSDDFSDFLLICVSMPIAYVVYDVIITYRISSVPSKLSLTNTMPEDRITRASIGTGTPRRS